MQKYLLPISVIILPIITWLIYFRLGLYTFLNFNNQKPTSIFLVLIISPIFEEIIFRGVLLDFLAKILNNNIIISSIINIIFTAFHYYNNDKLLYLSLIFSCGTIFTVIKIKYNKIIYPIFLHIYYNAFFIYLN